MARKPKQETLEIRLDQAINESMKLHQQNRDLEMQRDYDVHVIDMLIGLIAEARLKDVLQLVNGSYRVEINTSRK